MKRVVAPLVVLVCSAPLAAQEFPTPKPTEAHKVLSAEEGMWDATVKMFFQGPDGPPVEYKAVEKVEMVSSGLHSRSTFNCKMGDTDFEGHALIGYDPRSKEYVGTWVDNFTTVPSHMKGKYDDKKKTLTMLSTVVDATSGQELKQKQVTTFVDDRTKTFVIYLIVDAGGEEMEVKLMEMTAKKR